MRYLMLGPIFWLLTGCGDGSTDPYTHTYRGIYVQSELPLNIPALEANIDVAANMLARVNLKLPAGYTVYIHASDTVKVWGTDAGGYTNTPLRAIHLTWWGGSMLHEFLHATDTDLLTPWHHRWEARGYNNLDYDFTDWTFFHPKNVFKD